jgi:5-methylcytosine-specific restriction endonuclease McrA
VALEVEEAGVMFRSFWKGETRKDEKARKDRDFATARRRCRATVIARERGRCQRCGTRVSSKLPDGHPRRAEVNEIVPRSRGGDATDPAGCELLCAACHRPNGQHAPTVARQRQIEARRGGAWQSKAWLGKARHGRRG